MARSSLQASFVENSKSGLILSSFKNFLSKTDLPWQEEEGENDPGVYFILNAGDLPLDGGAWPEPNAEHLIISFGFHWTVPFSVFGRVQSLSMEYEKRDDFPFAFDFNRARRTLRLNTKITPKTPTRRLPETFEYVFDFVQAHAPEIYERLNWGSPGKGMEFLLKEAEWAS